MGFGLMTAGYIFLCSFNIGSENMYFDVFPDIVGWVLMVLGTFKLSLYTKKMRAASVFAAVLLPISLFTLLHGFGVFASLPNGGNDIYSILSYIYVTLLALFAVFILNLRVDLKASFSNAGPAGKSSPNICPARSTTCPAFRSLV